MLTEELRKIAATIKEDKHFSPQRIAELLKEAADVIDKQTEKINIAVDFINFIEKRRTIMC